MPSTVAPFLSSLAAAVSRLLRLCLVAAACVAWGTAHAADCRAGTLVTVVAHLDDDLLFVDPAIAEHLDAGWCVTTVHLIGGANGSNFAYVLTRERASRAAYARMAGVADDWDQRTVTLGGRPVHEMVLMGQPRVRLLELRLPGSGVRGGRTPIALLWDQGATLQTYPLNDDGSGRVSYDRAALIATLKPILAGAQLVYTLNPDTVAFLEHPDHIYSARITRFVVQALGTHVPLVYHVTYPTGGWPANLTAAEVERKRDISATYFTIDGNEASPVFGEYQWNGNWIARRYAFTDGAGGVPHADFVARPFALFNAASNLCLVSDGAARAPRMAACTRDANAQWRWQPLASYPGNRNDAALVSVASGQCIAERNGAPIAEPCHEWDLAQRWTPWDFGLIYSPQRHCLGEQDGQLTLRGCAALTTRFRWTAMRPSAATDPRLAGALYGNAGGVPSAVYVVRRGDGPGFDVYTVPLAAGSHATLWYANRVPFDPRALKPSCAGDALCFDGARFVLGDFSGNGRADLMAIAARGKGTAFWLMRDEGTHYDAPRLWFQSDTELNPARAQQYLAADFNGAGHASVLAVQQTDGGGLDLRLVGASADGRVSEQDWGEARGLNNNARLFAVRGAQSKDVSLIAFDAADGRLALTSLTARAGNVTIGARRVLPAQFGPDNVKLAVGRLRDGAPDALLLLTSSAAGAPDIDVWKLDDPVHAGLPVRFATLHGLAWADVDPAIVDDQGGHALMLYRRDDAVLGDFWFTGGNAVLVRYGIAADGGLGAAEDVAHLPSRYSETLRIDRLMGW